MQRGRGPHILHRHEPSKDGEKGKPKSPDAANGGSGNVRRAAGLSPEGAEYIRGEKLDESKLQEWDHAGKSHRPTGGALAAVIPPHAANIYAFTLSVA